MDNSPPAEVPDIFALAALEIYNDKRFYWDKSDSSVLAFNSATGLYDRWRQVVHSDVFYYVASEKTIDATSKRITVE